MKTKLSVLIARDVVNNTDQKAERQNMNNKQCNLKPKII